MKINTFLLSVICSLVLFTACSQDKINVTRGFYYWKNTSWHLEDEDREQLKNLQTEKLYVKFFEVEMDADLGAIPTAKTSLNFYTYSDDSLLTATMENLEIIPTVFVRNEALKKQSKAQLDSLADNIVFLIEKYYGERFSGHKTYTEIQIDCDWTPSTGDNYFRLLKALKRYSNKTLSCTLRLYPYKYPEKMGVPPVDKVTLMCYNLINPLAFENKNSILENEELESYLKGADKYPLHLDIALPVFSWIHVYQNKQFVGIVDRTVAELGTSIRQVRPMWYEVVSETGVDETYLKEGDLLKFEQVTPETIRRTIALLKEHIDFDEETTISLFHLDGNHLTQQQHEDLVSFYTSFGN